jgi:succinoglycan biosynthesis protein ExoA
MLSFSIIIPVKPGGNVKALEALCSLVPQSYPYEILVAEGSEPSRQRNLAAEKAQGDILYFLDDDSEVVADCLAQCASVMECPGFAVAGGPSITPDSDSCLQQLFGSALASPFGSGGVRNRYRSTGTVRETTERELILCNLTIRRDIFLAVGGFDERLYPNEENELLDRIGELGQKLVHIPTMLVHRSQRKTAGAFCRQMFSYGKGRAQQTLIAVPGSPVSFLPLGFVLYIIIFPLLPAGLIWKLPAFAYLLLDIIFTLAIISSSGRISAILLFCLFPLMHVANGIGLLYGFIGGKRWKRYDSDISVKRVKEFGKPDISVSNFTADD